jgi:TonB family protein
MQIETYKARPLNGNGNGHGNGNGNGHGYALPTASAAQKQSRHLLIALSLLLGLLVVVLILNRDFWFGSEEVADSDATSEQISAPRAAATSVKPLQSARPVAMANEKHTTKAQARTAETKASEPAQAASSEPIVASNRVVLPPLDVEVVAGDKHSTVHPGSNVMIAEIPNDPNRPAVTSAAAMSTSASQNERLSKLGTPALRQTIETTYPLLSQHSRVQGSVILEAVIGTDGAIEGLRVLSGPSILTTAAQQAVREWRFKPVLQNGIAVETKCRVTVNFSIHISDNNPSSAS